MIILAERDVVVHYDWNEANGIEEERKEKEKEEKKKEIEKEEVKEREKKKESKKKEKEKKSIKKYLVLASIVVLIAIILIFVNIGKIIPKKQSTGGIAAIVNGEVITIEELDTQYNRFSPEEKNIISKEFLLDALIDNKLLLQKAAEKIIIVTDLEIESEINKLKAQFQSEELFNQFLEGQGMTINKLREITIEQLKIRKVLNQEAFGEIEVTDYEIGKYYQENIGQFTAKEGGIRAAHILVDTLEDGKKILSMIKDGSDFKTLAKQYSKDTSAVNGGELGFFGKGVMVKEFEDAAFALKEEEISDVVKTEFGYHIIKRESDIIPLKEVKLQIKQSLLFSKQRAVFTTYMDQLRAQSDVKIYFGKEVEETPEIEVSIEEEKETFTLTEDEVCTEDGKPVIRLYSTTTCPHCNWIKDAYDEVVKEYIEKNLIKAYHWQLDTGDNTLTAEVENTIPKGELEIFKKYNPNYTVPTFVFGCKYYRIGNAYKDLEKEKKEFKKIINKLL